jgi:hypothetical protein
MGDVDANHLLTELQNTRAMMEKIEAENSRLLRAVTEFSFNCAALAEANERLKTEMLEILRGKK